MPIHLCIGITDTEPDLLTIGEAVHFFGCVSPFDVATEPFHQMAEWAEWNPVCDPRGDVEVDFFSAYEEIEVIRVRKTSTGHDCERLQFCFWFDFCIYGFRIEGD